MGLQERINRKLKRIEQLYPVAACVDWQPQPGVQSLAYHSPADELLYGGEPGGGKSDLILGLALTAHRRSLILRREATQLTSIVDRLQDLTGLDSSKLFDLGDRSIELGGCKDEKNKSRYKGRAHDLKAFDEITEFTRSQFEFIKVWNRSAIASQRCRVVATANPPTDPAGAWIVDYWRPWLDPKHPNPAQSGELRYYIGNDEVDSPEPQQGITPRSRCFIRSGLQDNPILELTGYGDVLANLPPELRSLASTNFADSIPDHPYQVIPTAWVKAAQERWNPAHSAAQDAIACDPARTGKDSTVIATRHGHQLFLRNYAGDFENDSNRTIDQILLSRQGDSQILVDSIGIGAGVLDGLRNRGFVVIGWVASNKSFRRDRSGQFGFANKRAEGWWNLRELLDPAYGSTLALPDEPNVLRELTAPRFRLTLHGIIIESKDEIRSRLGHSTDTADAIVMACDLSAQQYTSAFG